MTAISSVRFNTAAQRLQTWARRARSVGAAWLLAGAHALAFAAAANIDCTTNPAIFNTATNATQTGVRTVGSADLYWERASAPGSSTPTSWLPAVVSGLDPGWLANASNAGWIAENSCGGSGCSPSATYYYRFVFNLDPVVDPATLSLTFTMAVDDRIDAILVNGVSQGISGGNWYSTITRTLSSNWVNGTNQIWIRMTNTGGPGGIQVRSTGASMCRPKLEIVKQTQGGFGGPFTFTGDNGWASRSMSTTAAGAPGVSTGRQILSASAATTTIAEASPVGYWPTSAVCSGLSNGAAAALSGSSLVIPGAGLDTTRAKSGLDATCTVVNSLSTLTVQKLLAGAGRLSPADQFTVAIRTGGVGGTVVNSTANSTTSGANAIVTGGTASILTNPAIPNTTSNAPKTGTVYTITEAMAPGSLSALSAYNGVITCTDANGLQQGLPNGAAFNPATGYAILPTAGSQITCSITNTPVASGISGRVFLDAGAGGGVANNGVLAGAEPGWKGVALSLTNCGSTVYATTFSDGDGRYSFAAPPAATGSTVCVQLGLTPDQVATGASVGTSALTSGQAVAVAGVSYTYTRATPSIAMAWSPGLYTDVNFALVPANVFEPDGAKTALAGTSVTYPHMFQASTSGSVAFSVLSSSASPSLAGWTQKIFADPSCTGQLQPGAAQLFPPAAAAQSVVAGQTVCIVVQDQVPANALAQYRNEVVVQAAFAYANANPALSDTYRVRDVTTVSAVSLALLKEVRNVTQGVSTFGLNNQGKSGDILEYRITYTNSAAVPLSVLAVNDSTPAFSTFVSASVGVVPSTLSNCLKTTPANAAPAAAVSCATVQATGGTGSVRWRFTGDLMPGASGSVLYQVRID